VNKTRKFWSKGIASFLYRRYAGVRFFKMHSQICEEFVSGKNIRDILDIACGPADFLDLVSKSDPTLNLFGVDLSPKMVEAAKDKLKERAKITEGDIDSLVFEEDSFDLITIMMAFHHFSKKREAIETLAGLVRTNGRIVIADVIANSRPQEILWNCLEKITGVRGYVDHYREKDLVKFAHQAELSCTCKEVPGMAKRYKVCELSK